jgi:phosphoglycolate phosphatase
MMPRLLIFDLDGTLVDSREDLAAAVNRMRADYGLPPLPVATVSGFIGDGVHRLVARALGEHPADLEQAVSRMKTHYDAHLHDRTVLYPGVGQGLADLHAAGHVLALVSNKVVAACEAILRHFEVLPLFALVLGGDSLPNLKPHPEPLLETMRRTGFDASRTWMIGDHVTDLEAARAAGVPSAFVTYGIGHPGVESATRRFDSFAELVRFFTQPA